MDNILSDKELVEGMISNNKSVIQYFFFEKCAPMFHHINRQVYDRQAEIHELINELYLYLQADDWHKIRQLNHRVQLMTWTSTIAMRFFRKKKATIMENEHIDTLPHEQSAACIETLIHQNLEAENLINRLPNRKHRFVLRKLILEDMDPRKLAAKMGITVDNLYNIKRRIIKKLSQIVGKEKKNS